MEPTTLFARPTASPEEIINRVHRDLVAKWGSPGTPPRALIEVAETSVRALWDSKVKLFVPVLALRDARSRLGTLLSPTTPLGSLGPTSTERPGLVPLRSTEPRTDVLDVSSDVLDAAEDILDLSSDMHA